MTRRRNKDLKRAQERAVVRKYVRWVDIPRLTEMLESDRSISQIVMKAHTVSKQKTFALGQSMIRIMHL